MYDVGGKKKNLFVENNVLDSIVTVGKKPRSSNETIVRIWSYNGNCQSEFIINQPNPIRVSSVSPSSFALISDVQPHLTFLTNKSVRFVPEKAINYPVNGFSSLYQCPYSQLLYLGGGDQTIRAVKFHEFNLLNQEQRFESAFIQPKIQTSGSPIVGIHSFNNRSFCTTTSNILTMWDKTPYEYREIRNVRVSPVPKYSQGILGLTYSQAGNLIVLGMGGTIRILSMDGRFTEWNIFQPWRDVISVHCVGPFIISGNEKGDLHVHDFRNLQKYLYRFTSVGCIRDIRSIRSGNNQTLFGFTSESKVQMMKIKGGVVEEAHSLTVQDSSLEDIDDDEFLNTDYYGKKKKKKKKRKKKKKSRKRDDDEMYKLQEPIMSMCCLEIGPELQTTVRDALVTPRLVLMKTKKKFHNLEKLRDNFEDLKNVIDVVKKKMVMERLMLSYDDEQSLPPSIKKDFLDIKEDISNFKNTIRFYRTTTSSSSDMTLLTTKHSLEKRKGEPINSKKVGGMRYLVKRISPTEGEIYISLYRGLGKTRRMAKVYKGDINGIFQRHGKGVEFDPSTGKILLQGIYEMGLRKEITSTPNNTNSLSLPNSSQSLKPQSIGVSRIRRDLEKQRRRVKSTGSIAMTLPVGFGKDVRRMSRETEKQDIEDLKIKKKMNREVDKMKYIVEHWSLKQVKKKYEGYWKDFEESKGRMRKMEKYLVPLQTKTKMIRKLTEEMKEIIKNFKNNYRRMSDGLIYKGDFSSGELEGFGEIYKENNYSVPKKVFEGDFQVSQRWGMGKDFDESGRKVLYEGQFEGGLRSGVGELFDDHQRRVYQGYFDENYECGYGIRYYYGDDKNNTIVVGEKLGRWTKGELNRDPFCSIEHKKQHNLTQHIRSGNIQRIGSGSNHISIVYRIPYKKNNEEFAALRIFAVNRNDKEKVQLILSKMKKMIQLCINMEPQRHPNIIHIHGYSDSPSLLGYSMTYCPNGSVQKWIERQKKNNQIFLDEHIEQLIKNTLAGLICLQKNMIMHRSLSWENILIYFETIMDVRISDFDDCCLDQSSFRKEFKKNDNIQFLKEKCEIFITSSGWKKNRLLGIFSIAPEIWEGKIYTKKIDIFSFGIMLFQFFYQLESPYPIIINDGKQTVVRIDCPECGDGLNIEFMEPSGIREFGKHIGSCGARPKLYEKNGVKPWMKKLISDCWNKDISKRPSFEDILEFVVEKFNL